MYFINLNIIPLTKAKRSQRAWCAEQSLLAILNLRFWAEEHSWKFMGRCSITRTSSKTAPKTNCCMILMTRKSSFRMLDKRLCRHSEFTEICFFLKKKKTMRTLRREMEYYILDWEILTGLTRSFSGPREMTSFRIRAPGGSMSWWNFGQPRVCRGWLSSCCQWDFTGPSREVKAIHIFLLLKKRGSPEQGCRGNAAQ